MLRLLARLLYTAILLIEALIAIRFVLKLINANPKNELVRFVIDNSDRFVQPFTGITESTFTFAGIKMDLTSLIALAFFMILGYVAMEMIRAFSRD